jgi:hypothetical protein
MKKKFYSNGKLLITGEYLVLDAKALHYQQKGQNLIIEDGNHNEIIWKVMLMAVFGLKTPSFAAISSG